MSVLAQLRNLDRLPARGAVLLASPLPIVGGSGSPARVLALIERRQDHPVPLVVAGGRVPGSLDHSV